MSTIDGKACRARVSRETSGVRLIRATRLSIQPPASSSPGVATGAPLSRIIGTDLPSSYSGSRPAPRNPTDDPCSLTHSSSHQTSGAEPDVRANRARMSSVEHPATTVASRTQRRIVGFSGVRRRRRSRPTQLVSNRRSGFTRVICQGGRANGHRPAGTSNAVRTRLGMCSPTGRGFL
jgi:hypothetical protein